jgi:hypothetical protein
MDVTQKNNSLNLLTASAGVVTLMLGIVMLTVFPLSADLPDGFSTPIIAFEFAKTPEDISYLTGNGTLESNNRAKMAAGLHWDMAFPFAYAIFLCLLLLQLLSKGERITIIALPIVLLIVPLDIQENLTLLNLVEALNSSASTESLLQNLHLHTWLKWAAIGISTLIIAIAFFSQKQYYSTAISAATTCGIGVCWLSESNPVITEVMSITVFIFFLFFTLKSIREAWRQIIY